MIPEARPASILLLALALFGVGASRAGGEGAFGLSPGRLAELLAGKDDSPFLALSEAELADTGNYGPAAYCYLARRLEAQPSASALPKADAGTSGAVAARRLYRKAYDRSTGFLRREAGAALMRSLDESGLWSELLAFSCERERDLGPSWDDDRARLEAASALGLYADAAALAARIASAYPEEASKDAAALDYYAALASLRSSPASRSAAWRPAFRRLILGGPYSDWSARAFALLGLEPRLRASFSNEELHAAAMRDAVRRKDYGTAFSEARLASTAVLSPSASKVLVADAGKAFLYSGRAKEGEAAFAELEAAAAKGPGTLSGRGGVAWTALYYRARFARSLERWEIASSLFRQAASWADDKSDADSCLWYAAESDYRGAQPSAKSGKGAASKDAAAKDAAPPEPGTEASAAASGAEARAALLEALASASASWNDPDRFADLVDDLLGEALRARDFGLVVSMAKRLGGRLGPETDARIAYSSARIIELGLGARSEEDPSARPTEAASNFAALAVEAGAPLYYRALGAWRAGIEPTLVPPGTDSADSPTDAARGDLEIFLGGMLSFGLADEALSEIREREAELDAPALRRLAMLFSSAGHPDCALRLELDLNSRRGYLPTRSDFELLYPRPYLDIVGSRRSDAGASEVLAFGLVRSESVFRADIRSRAGAVGLTQLMPATAAAQAKSLGIKDYDLERPKDNLEIGLAYFDSLLKRTGGKPLRAMMAYNAGRGQYRQGAAETEGLPDDLLAEAFRLDETREYCRKILAAAVMYDALYYGKGLDETVGELVGSK